MISLGARWLAICVIAAATSFCGLDPRWPQSPTAKKLSFVSVLVCVPTPPAKPDRFESARNDVAAAASLASCGREYLAKEYSPTACDDGLSPSHCRRFGGL